jgi:signal transduction histidine kinase
MEGFHPGIIPRHSISMNAAIPFWSPEPSADEHPATIFRDIFEHAPIAVARCNPQGVIVEMNPMFERELDRSVAGRRILRLSELVPPQQRDKTDSLLRELLDSRRETISIEAGGAGHGQPTAQWTGWRQPGVAGAPDHALLIANPPREHLPVEEDLVQSQKWEAVGRMTGGVVHDFNNLLTGVMLYCDLLLSSLDSGDRPRRYAEEIRSAILHATGLVQQLLVFARPRSTPARVLNLNEIARATQDLLTRLLGENIEIELQLDPELGAVNIDQAQVQQILLNLVLNARDAMPHGGRITLQTSNCKFQPLSQPSDAAMAHSKRQAAPPALPCVLLVVADNGHGMTAEVRQRIFEPFFTTKNRGQGTGLGLTTVRSIVTTNRGLIHFESEPGRGTRVMILLPCASHSPELAPEAAHCEPDHREPARSDSEPRSAPPSQEIKKESLL